MQKKHIAIVFDFDETLAPESTSAFLDSLGIDVPTFWSKEVTPLVNNYNWDAITAYIYKMLEISQKKVPITKDMLCSWAQSMQLYPGVEGIFQSLREHLAEINPDINLEFYLISSGIGEIVRNTSISSEFHDIWACEFHYNENNEISFPKNIVSFTDKTRYLFQIRKNIVKKRAFGNPFEVNKKTPKNKHKIPFTNMIMVGDGFTDVPCFSLIKGRGGIAIGVYDQHDREKWGKAWGFVHDNRVSNLVPSDYSPKSALVNSLMMAITNIAQRIELEQQGYQSHL